MGVETTVLGGPLDGLEIQVGRRSAMVWIDLAANPQGRHRVSLRSGPGRIMHRMVGAKAVYAELTHQLCGGCCGWHRRAEACVLCGTPLRRK